jgi:hypothetical protein
VTIELNRRFVECHDDETSDPDLIARFGRGEATRGWNDLLKLRRVVFLAEAGAGKTTEMVARARQQLDAGHPSFYATLEDVGRASFESALRPADRTRLAAWLNSDQDAWLFIDSVDEAKHGGVKFRAALRAIATAIAGAERRAHVVLSGRYTDWQFRQDLAQLNEELPIPADQPLPPPPTADELVISTIHRERPNPPPVPERPVVVVMTGLDKKRVRLFANGKGIQNLEAFIEQIEGANLWQFARRPLDLDWLVEFWRTHRRLGSLAEMLEVCLKERLQESNLDRARQDRLGVNRAMHAVERVAAAMVFGRQNTIRVPDAEITLDVDLSSLDVADVLPEWSPQDRSFLLTRAVFDPATLGRARLHNDNQAVVRGYLTARWLHRLRKSNLSQQGLFDLLFAETYGVEVIKPTMQETAAWLSLWDENVAKQVARRQPFLLFTAGDPATLSRQTREGLLVEVVERIASGERVPLLDFDTLKRFCRPDLAQAVRKLWVDHEGDVQACSFLLRVIWLGGIKQCADLVEKIVFGPPRERYTRVVAGQALMAAADESTKARYGEFVKANCHSLPNAVVWDALEQLFPGHISIDDLLLILSLVDVADSDGGLGLDWHGPKLVGRLSSQADLERLLAGLLTQLGGVVSVGDREITEQEKVYFPMIAAAAARILELCPVSQAPEPAIDAAVRLGATIRTARSTGRNIVGDLTAQLQWSSARRRLAFWRFAERLAGHRMLGGRAIERLWDLHFLGWSISLSVEDIDWLLTDGLKRGPVHERRLAINSAMEVWRIAGSPDALRDHICGTVKSDAVMTQAVNSWLAPLEPSPEETKSLKKLEQLERRNAVERAKIDKSWIEFAAKLRDNPEEMQNLRPTTAKGTDAKLFHLWQLLNQTDDVDRKYAIDSVAPLEPIIGAQAAEGFRIGLIAHWRAWDPWLRSTRKDEELNQIRSLDGMGIAGVTLEANGRSDWAAQLSSDDARRAAGYATLELNGFPTWLATLAKAKPHEVRAVLSTEFVAELNRPYDGPRYGVLQDIARGDRVVAELMAPVVLDELEKRTALPANVLSQVLDIAKSGLPGERDRCKRLAIARFNTATDPAMSSLYIGVVFSIDGKAATEAVFARLEQMPVAYQPAFAQVVLAHLCGDRYEDREPRFRDLPLNSLERLVRLAYQTIRIRDDNVHRSGTVFWPNDRDRAEWARTAALEFLVDTSGRATYDAILRLAGISDLAVLKPRLIELANERAAKDSESASWQPSEAAAFEESAETEPQTPRDLQLVALRRLADMQYDLHHDDFQQGGTLAGLANEDAVQKWIADRMRLKQGRSYSVEREVPVADDKKPDMRLRAKATDVSVPAEVKVAESWTLEELEAALKTQLCGNYLRAREGRHGILLLVHQKPRPKGWQGPDGKMLPFDQVVQHLRATAVTIAGSSFDAPQPEVAVLDVSSFNRSKAANSRRRRRT